MRPIYDASGRRIYLDTPGGRVQRMHDELVASLSRPLFTDGRGVVLTDKWGNAESPPPAALTGLSAWLPAVEGEP